MPGREINPGELTPHRGHQVPMGEFRCTCGAVWDLNGVIQFCPTARPKEPGTAALIPKDPRRMETKKTDP